MPVSLALPVSLPRILILWPLAELVCFALMVNWIGFGNTVLVQMGVSAVGLITLRFLAAAPLRDLQLALSLNEPPAGAMLRSASVLLGGVLLVVPGFLTDLLGIVLIVPGLRFWLARAMWSQLKRPPIDTQTVDAEFHEVPTHHLEPPTDTR